jgi:hypothetical protein
VGFQARRVTSSGTISAVAYVNDVALAGGVVAATSFTSVATINGGYFSTTASTAILRIEFTYSGSSGVAKEVQVDNVAITPAS